MPLRRFSLVIPVLLIVGTVALGRAAADDGPVLELNKGDKIVLIGNTLAERMQHFGRWETFLHLRHYDKNLTVRNLGWSADTITTRLRSKDFQDHGHTLLDHDPDVDPRFLRLQRIVRRSRETGTIQGGPGSVHRGRPPAQVSVDDV